MSVSKTELALIMQTLVETRRLVIRRGCDPHFAIIEATHHVFDSTLFTLEMTFALLHDAADEICEGFAPGLRDSVSYLVKKGTQSQILDMFDRALEATR